MVKVSALMNKDMNFKQKREKKVSGSETNTLDAKVHGLLRCSENNGSRGENVS